MVLTLDCNSWHVARAWMNINNFEKKVRIVTALYPINCLKQIQLQILLHTCAPTSKLPFNTSLCVRDLYSLELHCIFGQRNCFHPNMFIFYFSFPFVYFAGGRDIDLILQNSMVGWLFIFYGVLYITFFWSIEVIHNKNVQKWQHFFHYCSQLA